MSTRGCGSSEDVAAQACGSVPGGPPRLTSVSNELLGQAGRIDWAWLSLRHGLLFLAPTSTNWAPYAFVHLKGIIVQDICMHSLVVTLAVDGTYAKPTAEAGQGVRQSGLRCNGGLPGDANAGGEPEGPMLQLVFLLPDGRWQVLELPRLRVQIPDLKQLERWRQAFAEHGTVATQEAAGPSASSQTAVGHDRNAARRADEEVMAEI